MRKALLMDIITANEYFELMRLLQHITPRPVYYATVSEIKEVIEDFYKRKDPEEYYRIDFLLFGLKNYKEGKIIIPGLCFGDKLTLNEFQKFKSKYEVILHYKHLAGIERYPEIAKLPILSALYGLKDKKAIEDDERNLGIIKACIIACEKLLKRKTIEVKKEYENDSKRRDRSYEKDYSCHKTY